MKIFKSAIIFLVILFLASSFVFGYSSHSTTTSRTFNKYEAYINDNITITVQFTNLEANVLRGFYYNEHIPQGLTVNIISTKLNGVDISNYVQETGSTGDVYAGSTPYRWVLELPPSFEQNNSIIQNSTVEIVYSVSSAQEGTFNFNEFNWIGYYQAAPEGERSAFGHSEDADKQTITFTTNPVTPVANFVGSPTSGMAPLTVNFTDQSTGDITEWLWNFGDTSPANNEQNPTHNYDDSGIYTVSLTVTGPGGTDIETKTNYITVTAPIQYNLTVNTVGSGSITLDPAGGTYSAGTEVKLTPVPDTGWAFNGWSGDLSGYSNPETIVMNTDKTVIATFDVDGDADGISDAEEDAGPNGGDGNSDTEQDSDQANVATFHTQDGTNYVTLESEAGKTLAGCSAVSIPSAPGAPSGVTFPYGFLNFTINGAGTGGATTLTLYLPVGADINTYWKYGSTSTNTNPHWYEFMYESSTQTGAEINGNIITLHFIDGQRGDDDITDDGVIIDQGGPGIDSSISGDFPDNSSGGGCFVRTACGN